MKVGNVKVVRVGNVVQLHVDGGSGWTPQFDRTVCNNYHAELEMNDIYKGLRNGRIAMQREVLDALQSRKLPGAKRGKLAGAIDSVRRMYGL